jgi:lipopolysaccharide transport system ATP-binding protein
MSDIAVKVENLSKAYRLGMKEQIHDTLTGVMASWVKAPIRNFRNLRKLSSFDGNKESDDVLWALKDVSFEVKHGEVLGIIGRNGAGKSTLLKILSRITDPTLGQAIINGRVGSLLEVGTGFHLELTGRENVYMNGTILGMTKKEIDRKFAEIVDFSGVEKFLDTPVKRYSSGMKVRLAFSVAAHLEPEILIIDEVLAVGDAAFQKKCLGKMQDVATTGRTVLFVSHQLEAVSNLCGKAILIEKGRLEMEAKTEEVISKYLARHSTNNAVPLKDRKDRKGDGRLRFTDTWIENGSGDEVTIAECGMPCKIVILYEVEDGSSIKDLTVSIVISSIKNVPVAALRNTSRGDVFDGPFPKRGRLECFIPRLSLGAGQYYYNVGARSLGGQEDWVQHAGIFEVKAGDFFGTGRVSDREFLVLMDHQWNLT